MTAPLRLAIVSPFLDKRHGTERCVAEQAEILARDYDCEIVLYCQELTDVAVSGALRNDHGGYISWRKIWALPGPHLLNFTWWFFANHFWRWLDRVTGKFKPDLVYTPGPNCIDANVIGVHIVFAEFYLQVREHLDLPRNPKALWPRLLHRRAYYQVAMALERFMYKKEAVALAGVAQKVRADLKHCYGRTKNVAVIYHGADQRTFNPERSARLREAARNELELPEASYVLLLAGNDWKKKGLGVVLEALARLRDPSLRLLVRGQDDPSTFHNMIVEHELTQVVRFLPQRPDVAWYYAAADAYVGPSLEDSFAMPPLEAMACGLPVIVSRQAGVSEIITHNKDGLILEDPRDVEALSFFIERLKSEPELANYLGRNAVKTAALYTWEANTSQLFELFQRVLSSREKQARNDFLENES